MNDDLTLQPVPVSRLKVDRNRELFERAQRVIYKEVDGCELEAYIFRPDAEALRRWDGETPRGCVVFFFGSAWDKGMVSQFAPQCVYFAARGMVAVVADYRVASRHGTGPLEAVRDARSVIRWLRVNADVLKIDPSRIAAGGASAGAHAMVCAAMAFDGLAVDEVDEIDEEPVVSCVPNALILFSPAVDTSRGGFGVDRFPDVRAARRLSPLRHVRKGMPPTIIFHGRADRVVPLKGVRRFARRMRWKRNPCKLIEFEGQGHGFFNFNVDPRHYEATISNADRFLVKHGFLEKNPEDGGEMRLD